MKDIMGRKQLEEKLRLSEQATAARASELEAIFEAMTDGVVVYDNQGHILRMNTAYRTFIALDANPEHALLSPDERGDMLQLRDEHGHPLPAEQRPVTRMLNGEVLTGNNTMDIILRALDGHELQLNISGTPTRDSEGKLVGGIMIFRDVTERRRLERSTREALEGLLEANRRMDEFMSIASHELKTPLTTIKGYIQLVARRLKNIAHMETAHESEQKQALESSWELLERTDVQVERLGRLVNELLDVSRIQANKLELHLEPCDLTSIVQDIIQDERQEIPERPIHLELPSDHSAPVIVDADRIGQVVSNFLSNALKYSAADRTVEVRLEVEAESAKVFVRDEGPGLAPEDQKRIWERFYRVQGIEVQSGTGGGLGLGLYICWTIIKLHSGLVGVDSTPGVGSTFWFSLPLAKEEV